MFWIDWDKDGETLEQSYEHATTLAEAVGLAYALCGEHDDAETATVYETYGGAYVVFDVHTGEIYEDAA